MANPHHYSNKIKIIGLQQNSQGFAGFPEVFAISLSFADSAGLSETCPKFTPHVIMGPWGLRSEGEFLTPCPPAPPPHPTSHKHRENLVSRNHFYCCCFPQSVNNFVGLSNLLLGSANFVVQIS